MCVPLWFLRHTAISVEEHIFFLPLCLMAPLGSHIIDAVWPRKLECYTYRALQQEAQLMLTTGSTRLAVSRGQQTWYHFGSIATFR